MLITFENVTGFGNSLYLDNIAIADFETPVAAFILNDLGNGNYMFANNSVGTDTYNWDFGDGEQSTEENPEHAYAVSGNYTITLIASNSWCSAQTTETIDITVVGTKDIFGLSNIQLLPNPGTDFYSLQFHESTPAEYDWKLLDAQGRVMHSESILSKAGNNTILYSAVDLPQGVYFLQMADQYGEHFVIKWVKI